MQDKSLPDGVIPQHHNITLISCPIKNYLTEQTYLIVNIWSNMIKPEGKIHYPFELATERLVIRPPSEAHAPQLMEAVVETLDALRPWMPWADHIATLTEAQENCQSAEKDFRDGSDYRLHLFLRESLTFVGGSGLHQVDWSVPKVEIGYWVRASCSGKGYITEAVREISRFAMQTLGANRVEIRMSSRNTKSRRIPERLGFTFEGMLRNDARHVDGTLRDTCVYAKTRNSQQMGNLMSEPSR